MVAFLGHLSVFSQTQLSSVWAALKAKLFSELRGPVCKIYGKVLEEMEYS